MYCLFFMRNYGCYGRRTPRPWAQCFAHDCISCGGLRFQAVMDFDCISNASIPQYRNSIHILYDKLDFDSRNPYNLFHCSQALSEKRLGSINCIFIIKYFLKSANDICPGGDKCCHVQPSCKQYN